MWSPKKSKKKFFWIFWIFEFFFPCFREEEGNFMGAIIWTIRVVFLFKFLDRKKTKIKRGGLNEEKFN